MVVMNKKNILLLVMIASFFIMSSFSLLLISEWNKSLDNVYPKDGVSSEAISTAILQTNNIKLTLAMYLSETGCNSCTKNKMLEKLQELNGTWAVILAQDESKSFEKLKIGKLELEKFVAKAILELNKDSKENIGELLDNDWALVTTSFLKPLTKMQEAQNEERRDLYSRAIKRFHNYKLIFIGLVSIFSIFIIFARQNFSKFFHNVFM